MSSSKIILGVIALVIVVWAVIAGTRSDEATDTATTTPTEETQSTTPAAGTTSGGSDTEITGSILDLIRVDIDRKCVWSATQDGAIVNGTIYVSKGKFRTDIEMDLPGSPSGVIEAHSIGDGSFVYSWTNVTTQGFKIRMTSVVAASEGELDTRQETQGLAQEYSYSCEPWKAKISDFALPSGIEFAEITL